MAEVSKWYELKDYPRYRFRINSDGGMEIEDLEKDEETHTDEDRRALMMYSIEVFKELQKIGAVKDPEQAKEENNERNDKRKD